jgi:hypothetical protein
MPDSKTKADTIKKRRPGPPAPGGNSVKGELLARITANPGISVQELMDAKDELNTTESTIIATLHRLREQNTINHGHVYPGRDKAYSRPCFPGVFTPPDEAAVSGAAAVALDTLPRRLQQILRFKAEPLSAEERLLRAIQNEPGVTRLQWIERASELQIGGRSMGTLLSRLKQAGAIFMPFDGKSTVNLPCYAANYAGKVVPQPGPKRKRLTPPPPISNSPPTLFLNVTYAPMKLD